MTRVVQIELWANSDSTNIHTCFIKSAPSAVALFPATKVRSGNEHESLQSYAKLQLSGPWCINNNRISTCKRASARSKVSEVTPTAPATAWDGQTHLSSIWKLNNLFNILMVIKPETALIINQRNFSIRCSYKCALQFPNLYQQELWQDSHWSYDGNRLIGSRIKRNHDWSKIPTNLRLSRVSQQEHHWIR